MDRITLSGLAGTGKSTIGKLLSKRLEYEFISMGNYSREYAMKNYGLTINEFQTICMEDKSIDKKLDEKFREDCNSRNNIVVDYRLGFYFVKEAFHILLKVSDQTAVKRIQAAARTNESVDIHSINARNKEMKQRFIDFYNLDFTDEGNFHLVVDTDTLLPDEITDLIIDKFLNIRIFIVHLH